MKWKDLIDLQLGYEWVRANLTDEHVVDRALGLAISDGIDRFINKTLKVDDYHAYYSFFKNYGFVCDDMFTLVSEGLEIKASKKNVVKELKLLAKSCD